MSKNILLALIAIAALVFFEKLQDTAHAAPSHAREAQTRAVVAAATEFLNSLTVEQRTKVIFAFTPQKTATAAKFARTGGPGASHTPVGGGTMGGAPANGGPGSGGMPGQQSVHPAQGSEGPGHGPGKGPMGGFVGEQYGQAIWSNYPVSDVPRPGLRLADLSKAERDAAMHLLQVALSPKGYQTVLEIMGADQALSETGTPYCSGIACYTIGIFGTPSVTKPWMLEFGGHHLGLNITILGEHGVMTPTLTGAQPAIYTANGKAVRVLAGENDRAFALLNALDETQRKQAILNYQVHDLVFGPGHAGEAIQPEGLKVSAMNEQQRALLLGVISEWAGIINDAYIPPRMAEIKAGLNDTYFAWSGPTTHQPDRNGSSYYRIQGPKLIIEFSPQGVGGDATMHVHTMYRDPTNDYGRAFTLSDK